MTSRRGGEGGVGKRKKIPKQASGLIWNDLCQVILFVFILHFFLTLQVQAASTMNQSDIRGLFRLIGTEPTVIFFVRSILPSKIS